MVKADVKEAYRKVILYIDKVLPFGLCRISPEIFSALADALYH